MSETAIIFGSSGQDGHYLNKQCLLKNISVIRVSRSEGDITGDISDYQLVNSLVKKHQPNFVFHLAANSTTRHEAIFDNHAAISTGTLNVLEAVYLHSRHSRVLTVGSGLQFQNTGSPISEFDAFEASSAYAASRIHAVYASRYYRSLGIRAYVCYLFHHESPFRGPQHVSQMVVNAAKTAVTDLNHVLKIGDISVSKEWTFAGDITNAMMILMSQEEIFEAVIGSGISYTIKDWASICFSLVNRDWSDHIQERPQFRAEYASLVSDPSTIKSLGWRPRVGIEELAKLMLNLNKVSYLDEK
jgi:GDPmannose 4,6-dehydratase